MLRRIPPGRVVTYGDVARAAGQPRAARAVGNLMRTASQPGLPYHRVVAAGGQIGGYGGRPEFKAALLRAEGLIVRGRRIVGFERHRWPSATPRSAGALRARGAGVAAPRHSVKLTPVPCDSGPRGTGPARASSPCPRATHDPVPSSKPVNRPVDGHADLALADRCRTNVPARSKRCTARTRRVCSAWRAGWSAAPRPRICCRRFS